MCNDISLNSYRVENVSDKIVRAYLSTNHINPISSPKNLACLASNIRQTMERNTLSHSELLTDLFYEG